VGERASILQLEARWAEQLMMLRRLLITRESERALADFSSPRSGSSSRSLFAAPSSQSSLFAPPRRLLLSGA